MHKRRGLFNVSRLILLGLMIVALSASLVLTAGVASAKTTSLTSVPNFDCVKCGF